MTQFLPESILEAFSRFVGDEVGLHFPRERWPDLMRGIEAAALELGADNVDTCVRGLMDGPVTAADVELLARHLTVGETYFVREPLVFDVLRHRVLPDLIASRQGGERRLRLWSAACSTGEEAYSLAIVLREVLPDPGNWAVTILATDINPHSVRQAEEGVFAEWSFRNAPAGFKGQYFRLVGPGRYEILPEIRKMVTFGCLNLAQDVYPSLRNETNAMDVILCRNVLMYFTVDQAERVVCKLSHALIEGGWLVVSPGDALMVRPVELVAVDVPEARLFRKQSDPTCMADRLPPGDPPAGLWEAEESPRLCFDEARQLYELGRYAEASDRLSLAAPREPASPAVCRLLAQSLANQGRLNEALLWCQRETEMSKSDPDCHYLRATILMEQGDGLNAARALRQALCLDPDFVPAHLALGNLNRTKGRVDVARRHYRHALRALADHPRDEAVPGSEGMTAGRLSEMIAALLNMERVA